MTRRALSALPLPAGHFMWLWTTITVAYSINPNRRL